MYKGTVKSIILFLSIAVLSISCSNNKSEEQIQAENLFSQAQAQYESSNYGQSLLLIDSINHNYPGILDIQRKAMHLKTFVVEKIAMEDSINNDEEIAKNIDIVNTLQSSFKYVKTKDMVEGYYVHKKTPTDNLLKKTNIEARIDEMGKVYLLSNLYGNPCKHTQLVARCNKGSVETGNVPYDKAMNYRFNDGGNSVEMVTFTPEKCDTFCMFITENQNENIKIKFKGSKSTEITLSPLNKKLVGETYEYATKKAALKKAQDLKLFYTEKLKIARKQQKQTAANLTEDEQK